MRGNAANKNVLKKYLYNVYKLEVSLFNQYKLRDKLINRIQYINEKEYEDYYEEESTDMIMDDVWGGEMFNVGCGFAIAGAIIGAVLGVTILQQVFNFSPYFLNRLIERIFTVFLGIVAGAILGLILFGIITLIQYLFMRSKINARNKEKELLNVQIEENNRNQMEIDNQKVEILENEVNKIDYSISKTEEIRAEYYSYNIIFPKYRYLEAVSSFYEYFASGRCSALKGHEGAYNIFENELRQGLIINKLDDIIDHLDRIEDNQYMLYMAIREGNKQTARISTEISNTANKLNQIESNTAVTAYYSKIGAENTECLKWLEIFNR